MTTYLWFMDKALISDSLGSITLRLIRQIGLNANLNMRLRAFDRLYT